MNFFLIGMNPLSVVIILILVSFNFVQGSVEEALNIKFGSFGISEGDSKEGDGTTNSTSTAYAVVSKMSESALTSVHARIRGDRLNELKKAESTILNRCQRVNFVPFYLNLRVSRDHFMGSLSNYSFNALLLCLQYTSQSSCDRESLESKREHLKALFEMARKRETGLGNSLLHPICTDAFKFLADALELDEIDFLIKNHPQVIFENFQVITSLKDYSKFTAEVMGMSISRFEVCNSVDYLSIPAFVRTATTEVLMGALSVSFEPGRHWKVLTENRSLSELFASKEIRENCRNYPFLSGFSGIEQIPSDNVVNPKFIIEKISTNGLTALVLASLLAFIQETNDLILTSMINIAKKWTDLHRNLHLEISTHTPASIAKINEEFNAAVYDDYNRLLYLREKREEINDLIEKFEEGKIPAHPSIVKSTPDWLKHLKILTHTPFSVMARTTFIARCDFLLLAPVHPEDEKNLVKLPRLIRSQSNPAGFFMEAPPELVTNPMIWSSLWRNVFFSDGETWRSEPEFIEIVDVKELERKSRKNFEIIYRDADIVGPNQLVSSWQKLAANLPKSFINGPRLHRFLASVSQPPPHVDYELPREKMIERKVFAKQVATVLKEIQIVDRYALSVLKANLADSAEVQAAIEHAEKELILGDEDGPSAYKVHFDHLERMCSQMTSALQRQSQTDPMSLFQSLRIVEASFASLGAVLSDHQINRIAENREIMKLLMFHGRAISRSQISGLLKSEIGRKFLKSNRPLLHNLLDYSAFTLEDFTEFEMDVELIRLGSPSLNKQIRMLSLSKRGFSTVEDPMNLVYSFGSQFWTDANLLKNLSLWELFNPMILAMNDQNSDSVFIRHMTGIRVKLHEKVLLSVALVFLVKWLISQDWNAFIYHVIKSRGVEMFGSTFMSRLDQVYLKYLVEGEQPGRQEIVEWMEGVEEARGSEDENVLFALVGMSVAIDSAPLTPFRESINKSGSPVASELVKPFKSNLHSPSLLQHVTTLVRTHFKSTDKTLWLLRLEILSEFTAAGFVNSPNASALCRCKLRVLPGRMDALVYKWALEGEGVNVERIFRDTCDGPVEIDTKTRKGVIPSDGKKSKKKKKNSRKQK